MADNDDQQGLGGTNQNPKQQQQQQQGQQGQGQVPQAPPQGSQQRPNTNALLQQLPQALTQLPPAPPAPPAAPAVAVPGPVYFARSPAHAIFGLIDYRTSEGAKLFNKNTEPLDEKFDLSATGLKTFLDRFHVRAMNAAWKRH